MAVQNHTPIDHLIQPSPQASTPPPSWAASLENEPRRASEPLTIAESMDNGSISEEMKEHIEVKKETVEIPAEVTAAGVEVVDHAADPIHIALPLADDKVLPALHAPVTSSLRWLGVLAMYILHKAHMTLKMVGGKATQVKE